MIGALTVIAEKGILDEIHTFVGSSAGAIICMLLAAGYSPSELKRVLLDIDLQNYIDYNFIDFFDNIGISSGEDLIRLMAAMLKKKGIDRNITFQQLLELRGKTLVMTGSNLTKERTDYFGPETTPELEVLKAIRITISYPLFFTPPTYKGDLYVDGALFEPYPINIFPDADSLGILVDAERVFNPDYAPDHQIEGFGRYLYVLVKTMMGRYVRMTCKTHFDHTIGIDLSDTHAMNFGVSQEMKEFMIEAGIKAARKYFARLEDKSEEKNEQNDEEGTTEIENEPGTN